MKSNSDNVVIYHARQRLEMGWFETWLRLCRNVITSKDMLWQLFRRDFLRPYRKSFIGVGWIFIGPIMGVLSWIFMAASGVLQPGDVGAPYPIYVLVGSSFWGLFMAFCSSATGTLGAGGGLLLQVNFPHDSMLVKTTAEALANFVIVFAVNLLAFTIAGYPPHWKTVFLPFVIVPLFLGGAALGLVLGIVHAMLPDLGRVTGMIFGALFYITPIVYSRNTQNELLNLAIQWNPMTYLITGPRDLVLFGRMDHWPLFVGFSAVFLFLFLIAWRLFFVLEQKLVERL